jgi:hypothetical protein
MVKVPPVADFTQGFERILSMLRDAILRTQVWQVHSVLRNIQIGTKRLDAVCRLVSAGGERSLLIAYKRSGYPGTIRATASMLRSLRRASGNADAMCVFAAPYVSSDGLDVCAEEEIACIDEAGNLLLPLPGAYVEIRGRGNAHPEKGNSGRCFHRSRAAFCASCSRSRIDSGRCRNLPARLE